MSSSYLPKWSLSENIHFNIPTKIWVTLTSHICFKFTVVMSLNLILTEKDNILNNFCSFWPIVLVMGTSYSHHLVLSGDMNWDITFKIWVSLTLHMWLKFTVVTSSNLILTEKNKIVNNLFSFYPNVLRMGTSYSDHLGLSENIHLKNTSRVWVILTSHMFQVYRSNLIMREKDKIIH